MRVVCVLVQTRIVCCLIPCHVREQTRSELQQVLRGPETLKCLVADGAILEAHIHGVYLFNIDICGACCYDEY